MNIQLKSQRDVKTQNCPQSNRAINSSEKMSNITSRNHSSSKLSKVLKIIKRNLGTKGRKINGYNGCNNYSLIDKINNSIRNNLMKHNSSLTQYNTKIIDDIIYDEKKRIVSIFKDYLLWDETTDFLKRFYYKHESIERLPKINQYYETYTLFAPVYFNLENIARIMVKNIKKKKRYLEMIEENEDKNDIDNSKKDIKEYNFIINPKDILSSRSMSRDHPEHKQDKTSPSISELNILMNINFPKNQLSLSSISSNDFKDNLSDNKSLFNLTIEQRDFYNNKCNSNVKKTTMKSLKGKKVEIKKLDLRGINSLNNTMKSNHQSISKSSRREKSKKLLTERLKENNRGSSRENSKNLTSKEQIINSILKSHTKNITNIILKQKQKEKDSIEKFLYPFQYKKSIQHKIPKAPKKSLLLKKKTNLVIKTNCFNSKKGNKNIEDTNSLIANRKREISNDKYTDKKINTSPNSQTTPATNNYNYNNDKSSIIKNKNSISGSNFSARKNSNTKSKNTLNIYTNIISSLNKTTKLFGNKKTVKSESKNKKEDTSIKTLKMFPNNNDKKIPDVKLNLISLSHSNKGKEDSKEAASLLKKNIRYNKSTSINSNNNKNNLSNSIKSKNISRNKEHKNTCKSISNAKSQGGSSIKGKNLVFTLKKSNDKPSIINHKNAKERNKSEQVTYHEKSVNFEKIKKKKRIEQSKKYPLTSRNDKDSIPFKSIQKLIIKFSQKSD